MNSESLSKWQLISLMSRGFAMAIGVLQSFFIVRLLTVGEWGLIQIAVSVGGALGIYQHLGLASGSTKEISQAKDDNEVFKVFITSLFVRYLMTLPLAVGLYFFAGYIAVNQYSHSELILPLQLYAMVMVFQGAQSILNSVISGTKRFKHLFLYQALITFVSLVLFIPFVYSLKINGYFYAMLAFNVVSTIILGFLALKPLKTNFKFPTKKEFKHLLKELLTISLAIYAVKIIYTFWEKIGPLVLGLDLTPEVVGIFAFAMLYAKKIVNVSDAITDVNLPVLSEKFAKDLKDFKHTFASNFNKVFIAILTLGFTAVYWAPEVVKLLIGNDKYADSLSMILPLTYAFILYSFINVAKSSVIIPAKMTKEMVISFVLLILVTVGFYFGTKSIFGGLVAMCYAMLSGSLVGFVSMTLFAYGKLKYSFWNIDHTLVLIQSFAISFVMDNPILILKVVLYFIFIGLFVWGVKESGFLTSADIKRYSDKFFALKLSKK